MGILDYSTLIGYIFHYKPFKSGAIIFCTAMKHIIFLLIVGNGGLDVVYGESERGTLTVQRAAWKLGPFEVAAKARNIDVPMKCCNVVRSMVQNPTCLCAVALSETAKRVGVAPQTALDVVKRCGVGSRPVGSKCRAYIWP